MQENAYLYARLSLQVVYCIYLLYISGADPASIIRGGPNSEIFLYGLRKLFEISKFSVVTKVS